MTNQPTGGGDTKIKLDFSLEEPEARNELVKKIIANTPSEKLSPKYLEVLANYILDAAHKKEKKARLLLTDNRMITINKRETSYEGLAKKFEGSEDTIYNFITNDKNIIFAPKYSITQQDLDEIPPLKELHDAIEQVAASIKKATGRKKYLLMKTLIEMRQNQYIIKGAYRRPIYFINIKKSLSKIQLIEKIHVSQNGSLSFEGVTLLDPNIVALFLRNYSKIKEETWDKLDNDARYMILDLENLIDTVLKEKYPLYFDLLTYKIDKLTNEEIQVLLLRDYGIRYSIEYISSLWCKKIPKLLAEQAKKDYIVWYFTEQEKGKWKKCSKCHTIKLAHNMFFSKNGTSKDGFYSICKDCRNKKNNLG